jgi:hypothetical protein
VPLFEKQNVLTKNSKIPATRFCGEFVCHKLQTGGHVALLCGDTKMKENEAGSAVRSE